MPSGRIHRRLHKSALARNSALIVAVLVGVSVGVQFGILYYFGFAIHRWIDPDLDLKGYSDSEARMIQDFGLFGYVLRAYFNIYARVCYAIGGKHRGWMSHSPLLSTFIRLVWLLWWVPFVVRVPWEAYVVVWAGLAHADLIHILADFSIIRYRGGG